MNKRFFSVIRKLSWVVLLVLVKHTVFGQNNLSLSFPSASSAPDFLNICGAQDTMVVRIELDGSSPDARTNIQADVEFFKGVRFSNIIPSLTTAGVSLQSQSGTGSISLDLPDLIPGVSTFADVAFSIAADCQYIDTININNTAQVRDTWDFSYDLGGSATTESDNSQTYRDAFVEPTYQLQVNSTIPPLREQDCFMREIQVDNSGLLGFVDTLNYTAVEGSAFHVSDITANGISLPITKAVDPFGDTTITAILDGTHFALNTIGAGGPAGNGNGFFDPNETLIIQETICFVDCAGSLQSSHTTDWGCYGRSCTDSQVGDFLDLGSGNPIVDYTEIISGSTMDAGYCQSGSRTMQIQNVGNEVDLTFGTLRDVSASIILGNGSSITDDGITILTLDIAGVSIASPGITNDLHGNPLFTTDPDGVGVGLEDEDGDGYFDDLPIGHSFVMDYTFDYDCSVNDTLDLSTQCESNNVSAPFSARVDYTDNCNERVTRLETSFYRATNETIQIETFSDSDANTIQDTFYVSVELTRLVQNFEKNCAGNEQLITRVFLPTDVIPVISETSLFYNGGTVSQGMISNAIVNDTLTLVFDVSGLASLNGLYDFEFAFTANCNVAEGQLILDTQIEHYCPPCDCSHLWYCDMVTGPQVHVVAPCPPPACPRGLKATSFDVERTTFGFADVDYTIPFDTDLANKKVAVSCDSVRMNINGIVGDLAVADSAYIRISHDNVDMSTDLLETFLYGNGVLRISRGGVDQGTAAVLSSDLVVNAIGQQKELLFHLDGALTNMGVSLLSGDSLFFEGNFKLNELGPFTTNFSEVPNLRGEFFSAEDGTEYSCDNYGENFVVAKTESVFSVPNISAMAAGCEDVYLQYSIVTINTGFQSYFGSEYRPSVKVDSIIIDFDTELLNAYDVFVPEISIPDHPVHGNSFFAVPGFDNFPGGQYVLRIDTIGVIPTLNTPRSYDFNFRVRQVPTCTTEFGSSNSDNIFNFDPTIYFTDRYYATTIGDGSCSNSRVESIDGDIVYNDPPDLSMTPASAANLVSSGDTLTYNVQVCNDGVEAAGTHWFAFIDSTSAFEFISIEDATDTLNIIPLSETSFGTVNAHFVENGTLGTSGPSRCKTYRIKGRLMTCGNATFHTQSGWNCTAYGPAWNPDMNGSCATTTYSLTASSSDGLLDGNINQEPMADLDLCDTNQITIVIRNTDLGNVFDLNTKLILPEGIQLVPGSVEIAYPSNTAFVPALSDPISSGSELRGNIVEYMDFSGLHASLDADGLPGFDNLSPSVNELLLRFRFDTDCNFLSGSQIFYDIQGVLGCGDATNFDSGETAPINLSLPSVDPNVSYAIRFDPRTAFFANTNGQLNVVVNNKGTVASTTSDSVEIRLPNNFIYQSGSTNGVLPGGYDPGDPVISTSGSITSFSWPMQAGVVGGDSMAFNFQVLSPDLDCIIDSIGVVAFTRANASATCSASGSVCQIEVVTSSSNGSIVTALPIYNQRLVVNASAESSICAGGLNEDVTISGTIQNVGADLGGVNLTAEIRVDANGDRATDASDLVVGTFMVNGPILSGNTVPFNSTLPLPSSDLCRLYIHIDTLGIGGCDPLLYLVPEPRLQNAGADIQHCGSGNATLSYTLGDPMCSGNSNITFVWNEVTPGANAYLSSLSTAAPTFDYTYDGSIDTIVYTLQTTRSGCISTTDTIMIELNACLCDAPMVQNVSTIQSLCGQSIGSIDVDLVQHDTSYFYDYTEVFTGFSFSDDDTASDLPGGSYRVVISDKASGSCLDSVLVAVRNADGPEASVVTSNATCSQSDGSATLSPSDFNYLWEDGNTMSSRNDLPAGQHGLRVEDPNRAGCYNYLTIDIGTDNNLSADFMINSFATCGMADGSATITVTGGSGSYSYSWPSGTDTENTLAGGITLVTITDNVAGGCTLEIPLLMTNGNEAATTVTDTIDVLCYGGMDGGVIYDVNYEVGFVTPVDTIISDGVTNFENNTLPAGRYCILMEDASGCIYGGDCFEVKEPEQLSVQSQVDPLCTSNRGINIEIKGGTAPYNTNWLDLAGSSDGEDRSALSSGLYELIVSDANGCALDTASYFLEPCLFFVDTVVMTQTETFEPDLSSFGDVVTMTNVCETLGDTSVFLEIDEIAMTIDYTGVRVGTDTACIEVCNTLGVCDTIEMRIHVEFLPEPPIAVEDTSRTTIGKPITIELLRNDTIEGSVVSYEIIEPALSSTERLWGQARINPDQTVTYNPDPEFCERTGYFYYSICNQNTCDTARVSVFIECTDIKVFNALSPNGDGQNDYLHIANIDDFPNNTLSIYNRWGNLVFETEGYSVDNEEKWWKGTWDGKDLPDGTYYYILTLNDQDNQVIKGSLEIMR